MGAHARTTAASTGAHARTTAAPMDARESARRPLPPSPSRRQGAAHCRPGRHLEWVHNSHGKGTAAVTLTLSHIRP